MKDTELIECLKSFIKSKHLTNEWDKFRDKWFSEIHSEASNEPRTVSNNEQKGKKCNPRGTILKCDFDHNLECKDCPQFY